MKITHISSATCLIEYNGTKILTDPWLVGDEFYGSWTHYPPMDDIDFSVFDDVDYIYISHIHPDHMSRETLERINKDIPVLIHSYDAKFVKMNLERWGRNVIELSHGDKFECGNGLDIYIYAADNCDPSKCFKYFGCGKMESKMGSTGIDTFAVIEAGDKCILNVNDCPYSLTESTLDFVLPNHPEIDLLLVGYAGAGSYPQCWDYSDKDKLEIYGVKKKSYFLTMGLDFINKVQPRYYMPFAGTYVLRGKNAFLEKYKVVPELQDALSYYKEKISCDSKGVLLNSFEWFDLESESVSNEYVPINYQEKIDYVETVLSKHKYEYELDPEPSLQDFYDIIPQCYERYDAKRQQLNFLSATNIYIYLPDEKMIKVSCCGQGYEIINVSDFKDTNYVSYRVDPKLLLRILKGPRYAHWNNAEIGSHIQFARRPEIYERALYYAMNYFHT